MVKNNSTRQFKKFVNNKTRKNIYSSPKASILRNFQREITVIFFEMLLLKIDYKFL